jgi:hypothetical protein
VTWQDGRAGGMTLIGRARDVVTPQSGGNPVVVAEDSFRAQLKGDRTIVAITTDPVRPGTHQLVGARGGGHLRRAIDDVMPEERHGATPLHLILDDISGTSLIAAWAWSQWSDDWLSQMPEALDAGALAKLLQSMEGVCTGFAPGSSSLTPGPNQAPSGGAPAPGLRHADDPGGWHAFPAEVGVTMRRARRIDVALGEFVHIDAAFQDSALRPDGGRMALHEYGLTVVADASTLRLVSIQAHPRVLPFPECPSATLNLPRLLGTPLPDFREKVVEELKGTAGCTHLNDALRALAAVPTLLAYLPARS